MGKYAAAVHDHLVLPARVTVTAGRERALGLLGRAAPPAVPVRLIIDTGSSRSSLVPSVISVLSPPLAGAARVETSLASGVIDLFWIRLDFPGTSLAAVPEIAVASLRLPASLHAFHGVTGRDLLRRWESLLFEGRRGRFIIRDVSRSLFGWLRR